MPPMKLAIIGGGPSAFYVASRILSLLPAPGNSSSSALRVHMYDRLWAPHGLVRYGVAPDHPEVKNCTHKFDIAANDPRFRFFGNVNVGNALDSIPHALQVSLSTIFENYTHVIFATGCTLPTLHPALAPSPYCVSAASMVHWYTQHPSRPSPPPLEDISHVALIGNGNVSLDIARMLLTSVSVLSRYDVPESVLEVLSRSTVKHVSVIARRGPLEAAFTAKELREMISLPEASMVPIDPSILIPPPNISPTRQQSRILQLLEKGSKARPGTTPKSWSLDFFRSPTNLIRPAGSSLAELTLAHTTVDPKSLRAVTTGETTTLPTSLVVTSLGFHGETNAPFFDSALGHLRTVSGRIVSSTGNILKNVYASGWAATGAKGVLASTMINAYAIADTVLTDWMPKGQVMRTTPVSPPPEQVVVDDSVAETVLNSNPHPEDPPLEIQDALKEGLITEYRDWKIIDMEEVRRGEALGKERERMGWEEARNFLAEFRGKQT